MLGVGKQYNTIVVTARGQHLHVKADFQQNLKQAATEVAELIKLRFKVGARATLDFRDL